MDSSLLSPTPIPLIGVGTTCFSSCCEKDSANIFTMGRLPPTPVSRRVDVSQHAERTDRWAIELLYSVDSSITLYLCEQLGQPFKPHIPLAP
jgi:hypothetical protein